MVLAVPKAFILNSLLDSKLSDSLFIINSFIIFIIMLFLSMLKNTKKFQKCYLIIHSKIRLISSSLKAWCIGKHSTSFATLVATGKLASAAVGYSR